MVVNIKSIKTFCQLQLISKMDSKGYENESDLSSELDLDNFKKGVAFPFEKLQEIVYNDNKYSTTIVGFIRQGLKKIKRDELEYALIYFNQAQKILQYGASCGRIIDRNLIVCVLHNQACCYQKLNELSKAIKYIQAIIFNLKAHLKSIEASPTASNIMESALLKNMPQFNRVSVRKKLQLAQYSLQFCSVNSQMKMRKAALESAKAAIQLYKAFFIQLKIENSNLDTLNYANTLDKQKIKTSLKEFKIFREDIDLEQIDEYLKTGRYYVRRWMTAVKINKKTIIDKLFRSYSIGNFVELEPTEYDEQEINNNSEFEPEDVIKEFLHFSMGYFQMATEYRLIADERYKIDHNHKLQSEQFKVSEVYHILSVIFVAMYVPYDILFMEQILSSYEHHYKKSLNEPPVDQSKPNLLLIFLSEANRKRQVSKKRKVSELKSLSKKKKPIGLGFSQKREDSVSKIGNNSITAKQEYFGQSIDEKTSLRTQRMNSNQSKNSEQNQRRNSELSEKKEPMTYRRERMKTKNSEQNEKALKKKERAYEEYCAMPLSAKKRKKSVQKVELGISYGSRRNSRTNSNEKSSTLRKISHQKSMSKQLKKVKGKEGERKKEKLGMQKSPGREKQMLNSKKRKTGTIKNYYL